MAEENEERDFNGQEALKRNGKEKSGKFAEDVKLQLDDSTTVVGTTQDISLDEKFKLKSSQKLTVFSDANNLLLAVSQTNETGNENLIASFTKFDDGKVLFSLDAKFYDQFNANFPNVLPTIKDEEKGKATYSFEVGKVNLTKDGNINDIQLKGVAEADSKKFGFFFSALGFQATSAAGRGLVSNQGKNPFNISVGKAFLEEQKKENSVCTMESNPALTSALHIALINDARKKEKDQNKTISIRIPEKAEANAKDVVTLYSVPLQIESENEIKQEFLNIKKENGKTFVYIQSAGIKKDGTSSKVRIVPDWKEINRASLVEDKENGAYLRLDDGKSGIKSITANIKIPTRNNEDYDHLNRSLFTLINDGILKEEFKASEESLGEGKNASYEVKNGNENTNIKVKIFDYGQDQQANLTSLGNDIIATMKKSANDDSDNSIRSLSNRLVSAPEEKDHTNNNETTDEGETPDKNENETPDKEKEAAPDKKKDEEKVEKKKGTSFKIKKKNDNVRAGLYGIALFCTVIACIVPMPFAFLTYIFFTVGVAYDLELVNDVKEFINWVTGLGKEKKPIKIKEGKDKILQKQKDDIIKQKNIKIAQYNRLADKIKGIENDPTLSKAQKAKKISKLEKEQDNLRVEIEKDLISVEIIDKQIKLEQAKQAYLDQQQYVESLEKRGKKISSAEKADLKAAEKAVQEAEKSLQANFNEMASCENKLEQLNKNLKELYLLEGIVAKVENQKQFEKFKEAQTAKENAERNKAEAENQLKSANEMLADFNVDKRELETLMSKGNLSPEELERLKKLRTKWGIKKSNDFAATEADFQTMGVIGRTYYDEQKAAAANFDNKSQIAATTKTEFEKISLECGELSNQFTKYEELNKQKSTFEKSKKEAEEQLPELTSKYEKSSNTLLEANRTYEEYVKNNPALQEARWDATQVEKDQAKAYAQEIDNLAQEITMLQNKKDDVTAITCTRISKITNQDGTLTALENAVFEDLDNGTSTQNINSEQEYQQELGANGRPVKKPHERII